jgi:hypothetical protein
VEQLLVGMPWWGYALLFGILFSGYMTLRISIEERRVDHEWIEKEGNVYIERMNKEKLEREGKQKNIS